MSWTDHEYAAARQVLLAMSDVFKHVNVTIETTPELDRQMMDRVLSGVRNMHTLKDHARELVEFIATNRMTRGEIPHDLAQQLERALTVRELRGRERGR